MRNQELIKERNELAKELLMRRNDLNATGAEIEASSLMERLYGDEWSKADMSENEVNPVCECQNPTVSLYTDEQGTKWVRIRAWGEDFSLSLFNMKDGNKDSFTWEEAMQYAESHGQELPSKKQWMLVDLFREDIDKIIEDNGGDPLERWYWSKSVSQYYSNLAWFYYGYAGTLNNCSKYNSYGGRSLVYHH